MARVKKPDTPPPPPKHPRECKHGCTDCKYLPLDVKAFPCRDCERWNYWEDAHPEKNNTMPFPPPPNPVTPVQDPSPSVNEPKKRGKRTKPIISPAETASNESIETLVTPKKRGRKPKTATVTSPSTESESSQQTTASKKRVQKTTDDTLTPLPEKEQLSLF